MNTTLTFLLTLWTLTGCTGPKKEESNKGPALASTASTGKTVTIKGSVSAKGKATSAEPIRMNADPYCSKFWQGKKVEFRKVETSQTEGLKGAVVYLKNAPKTTGDSTKQVVIDQKGCLYEPTVLALQVGQPLIIKNSDATLHNVHAIPKLNQEFNFGMATAGGTSERKFGKPEIGIRFKCDVHGWMSANISVFDHPNFTLTDASGNFEISGVPEGAYVLEAYHPVLGTREGAPNSSTLQY